MTPKQKALSAVAIVMSVGLGAGIAINLMFMFMSLASIGLVFSIGVMVFFAYMIYDMELAKAEALERLNKE